MAPDLALAYSAPAGTGEYSVDSFASSEHATSLRRSLATAVAWLPLLMLLAALRCESTEHMSSDVTVQWVTRLCASMHVSDFADAATANLVLRKMGHVLGFGLLGLLCMQRWRPVLIERLSPSRPIAAVAALLGVASAAVAGALDEAHQRLLVHRSASVEDVVLDTAGAVLLVAVGVAFAQWREWRAGASLPRTATV